MSKKGILLCFIVIVSVFLGAFLVQVESKISSVQDSFMQENAQRTSMFGSVLERSFVDLFSILEITSNLPEMEKSPNPSLVDEKYHGVPEDSEIKMRNIAKDILHSNPRFNVVYYTLPNGNMYMVEPFWLQQDITDINFSFRDWYQGTVRTNSPYVSEVFEIQGTYDRSVAVTVPIKDESGNLRGIWGGIMDLNYLADKFNALELQENENVFLADHNGNIIVSAQEINHVDSLRPLLTKFSNGISYEKTTNRLETIDEKPYVISNVPVHTPSHTWLLVFVESADKIAEEIQTIRMISFLVTGISILSVLFASYIVLKKKKAKTTTSHVKAYSISMIVAALILSGVFLYLFSDLPKQQESRPLTSNYLIQNLKGDTIDTWLTWRLVKGDVFHIHVLNSPEVTSSRLDSIYDVIMSSDTLQIENSVLHKSPTGKSTFYTGWQNSLESINKDTKFAIPKNIHFDVTDIGEGHVIIQLTSNSNADGYSGYTKSIVDSSQNQILKSVVTIYDADKLSEEQFRTILRHELGHAFGLAHSTDPDDLMHPTIQTDYPYISECNLSAITALYDGSQKSKVVCEN